jgi:hypothetical protein
MAGYFRMIYPFQSIESISEPIWDGSFATTPGSLDISMAGHGYPCKTWLVPIPQAGIVDKNQTALWNHALFFVQQRFADPLPLIPGTNSFGIVTVIERKVIQSSFLDMMGFKPVSPLRSFCRTCQLTYWYRKFKRYKSYPLLSIGMSYRVVNNGRDSLHPC